MMWSKRSKLAVLIFSILFFLFLVYISDFGGEASPQVLQVMIYVSLPITGGVIVLSLCSLLGTLSDMENSATSIIFRRTSEDPVRNFLIGFFIVAYVNLVRPPLATAVSFLPYVEWVTIVLTVYVLYSTVTFTTEELYVSSEDPFLKKHVQAVRRETGHDLLRITSVMEQFVNNEVKEPLLVYLTLHLQRLGRTEEDILKILRPLIHYQNDGRRHKLYFLALPRTKRKLAVKDKKAREDLLHTLLQDIDRLRLP